MLLGGPTHVHSKEVSLATGSPGMPRMPLIGVINTYWHVHNRVRSRIQKLYILLMSPLHSIISPVDCLHVSCDLLGCGGLTVIFTLAFILSSSTATGIASKVSVCPFRTLTVTVCGFPYNPSSAATSVLNVRFCESLVQ